MTYKRFFWRVGRTVLLYGWFIGLSVLMAALLERGLLPQIRAVLSWGAALVLWIGSAVLSFFALFSCLRQFALNDTVHYLSGFFGGHGHCFQTPLAGRRACDGKITGVPL